MKSLQNYILRRNVTTFHENRMIRISSLNRLFSARSEKSQMIIRMKLGCTAHTKKKRPTQNQSHGKWRTERVKYEHRTRWAILLTNDPVNFFETNSHPPLLLQSRWGPSRFRAPHAIHCLFIARAQRDKSHDSDYNKWSCSAMFECLPASDATSSIPFPL